MLLELILLELKLSLFLGGEGQLTSFRILNGGGDFGAEAGNVISEEVDDLWLQAADVLGIEDTLSISHPLGDTYR